MTNIESVEEVNSPRCSPVVFLLALCLALVLAALIAVTALHTHAKLTEGCDVADTSFSTPCDLGRRRFRTAVGEGSACDDWGKFACGKRDSNVSVTHHQLLLLAVTRQFCSGVSQKAALLAVGEFFNSTQPQAVVRSVFGC